MKLYYKYRKLRQKTHSNQEKSDKAVHLHNTLSLILALGWWFYISRWFQNSRATSSVTKLHTGFPLTFPLSFHSNTYHTQFPGSLPNFPFHLVQLQAQLLTWDHSRPFWRGWWRGLRLACQGARLPLQQQSVTNSLVHKAQHIHSSTHFTPCTERPGLTSDHSLKQLTTHTYLQ